MSIAIKLKHSATANKAPLPTDLAEGELALNINAASPAAYIKDSAGAVVKLAGMGSVSTVDASEATKGIVELATAAETATGTDATRAVHPAGLKVELDKKAPLASPALTGTPTAPTAAAGTNTTQLATTAFVTAAVDVENTWDRTGTTLSPKTAGDVITVSAGTDALPGLTPVGDPDTGVWSPGPDQLAISTGGHKRVVVTAQGTFVLTKAGASTAPGLVLSSGDVGDVATVDSAIHFAGAGHETIGTTKIYSTGTFGLRALCFATGPDAAGTERVRIDSSGRLLVGTPASAPGDDSKLQIDVSEPGALGGISITNSRWFGNGSRVLFQNVINSTGTIAPVASVTGEGDGENKGRLLFSTTAGGASAPTERMRISQDSTIGFGNTVAAPAVPVFKMTLKASGVLNLATTTVYADNAAAIAGGLIAGDIYRKADGTLMITF